MIFSLFPNESYCTESYQIAPLQDFAGEIELTVITFPETLPLTLTFCPAYLSICLASPLSVYTFPLLTKA